MKGKNNLKDLNNLVTQFAKSHNSLVDNIYKNYNNDIISNLEAIIDNIANDYNLNSKELQNKYIKEFKKNIKKNKNLIDIDTSESSNDEDNEDNNSNILEKIDINNNSYYFERKEGGNIFNKEVEKVGEYKNGQYLLF